jgi:xanthine dehydrogenase large subunit
MLLAEHEIEFHGQAFALVVADSYEVARKAARLVQLEVTETAGLLDVDEAIAQQAWVRPPHGLRRSGITAA